MVPTGDKVPESQASQIKGGRTGRGRGIEGPAPPSEPSGPISVTGTELAVLSRPRDTRPRVELFALQLSKRTVPETARASPKRPHETASDGPLAPGLCAGRGT